jgi:hypothetical protein
MSIPVLCRVRLRVVALALSATLVSYPGVLPASFHASAAEPPAAAPGAASTGSAPAAFPAEGAIADAIDHLVSRPRRLRTISNGCVA